MNKPLILPSFCLLILLGISTSSVAQVSKDKSTLISAYEKQQEVFITLLNGNTYTGLVVSIDDEMAGIQNNDGVFNLRYDRIESIRLVDPSDKSSRWYKNPANNKLFITQSGKMLEPKTGYYQNTYIFISNFSYGLTKNFSVNAGFSMIPGLGVENQLYLIGAKVGGKASKNISLSANINYYNILDSDQGITSLFGSSTFTFNNLDLTAGLGVGFDGNNTSDALVILGAQWRISERFALLSENMVLPDIDASEPLLSFRARFIGRRIATDLGFFSLPSETDALVPLVRFAVIL